ncbi:hypothetical protein [Polyangium mundeleinium]|uniref:Porin n=1 Tax=Polyangium mundeleinium TaxID=2995306 RepID=A0ABT5EF56_9BACT|nr:hypothetical protein [Polyangium mundeleinium]MDC0740450.1 hypothetical protein [Polyangium mundeleinium]
MARSHRCPDRAFRRLVVLASLLAGSAIGSARAETKPKPPEPPVRLRLSGYVQADAVAYRQSSQDEINPATGAPLNEDRFTITRARLRADVSAHIVSGALELDANTVEGPAARVIEAEVSARWQGANAEAPPYVMATLGLFKIPFGVEGPERERSRLFLERTTTSRALFPGNYDLGLRLSGGYRVLRYAVALMNGEPVGQVFFPARDPNGGKDVLGRIGVDTRPLARLRVQGGFSALSGTGLHRGTPSTKDVLVWRDENENGLVEGTEIRAIPGTAATPSENFDRFALGADLRVTAKLPVVGESCLFGEIVRAQNIDRGVEPADPIGAGRDLRELGFHVGITQELSRYVMIGVRYDRYNPDQDASEQRGKDLVPRDSTYSTVSIAAALRYTPPTRTFARDNPFPALRVVLEYDHRNNALGRTAGGLPTTLGDDSFAIRGEVSF